jgi:hypothetical protein
MDHTAREPIAAINFESGPRWPVDRHVMLRIDYVVSQVSQTHRGQDEEAIAHELTGRLRALGVAPLQRQIQLYAEAISRLPQLPPPRRAV